MLSLKKAQKLFLKLCQQPTLSFSVLLRMGSEWVASELFALGQRHGSVGDGGLWGRGHIDCHSQPIWLVPSGHSQSLAWPFKEPTFSSSDACYYFRLLLLQQKTTSIYFKVIFKPWIFTGRVKQGMVGRYTFLSLISMLLLYTFRYLQEGYYFFSAFPQLS